MDWKLEVVPVPVSDVGRAKSYEKRLVQLTPPGSGCSIHLSTGFLNMPPGVLEGLQLVVSDIETARVNWSSGA